MPHSKGTRTEFPPPRILGLDRHGPLSTDAEATPITVVAGPWDAFQDGDQVRILWGDGQTVVATQRVSARDAGRRIPVPVPRDAVIAVGDGPHDVHVQVLGALGDAVLSPPATVGSGQAVGRRVSAARARGATRGTGAVLEPPKVDGAEGATGTMLDAAKFPFGTLLIAPAQERIPNGSLVTFYWQGADEEHTAESTADGEEDVLALLSEEHIAELVGKTAEIRYEVEDYLPDTPSVRAVGVSDPIRVRVIDRRMRLPPPYVPEAPNGVLDPTKPVAQLKIMALSEGTTVEAVIEAKVPFRKPSPIGDLAKPPSFTLNQANFIQPNINTTVSATYTVTGPDYEALSEPYVFTIGSVEPLPPPIVPDLKNGALDAKLSATVVRVPASAVATPGTRVKLLWNSVVPYSHEDVVPATGLLEFPIDAKYIAGNRENYVVVSYEIGVASEELKFLVTNQDPLAIDPTPVTLAVGATAQREATGGSPPYTYASSDSAVASVYPTNGLVTALKEGSTTITVSDVAGQEARYSVTVMKPMSENLDDLPAQVIGLNQAITTPSGLMTITVLALQCGITTSGSSYLPVCSGMVLKPVNNARILITFAQPGNEIEFGVASIVGGHTAILLDANGETIDTVTTPHYGTSHRGWFRHGPTSRPIKSIIFQTSGAGDCFLDNFSFK